MKKLNIKNFQHSLQALVPNFQNTKFLIALSGGLDSVVLTYLFHELELNFGVAHINYNLRGKASIEDELWTQQWAQELPCPYFSKSIDTLSLKKGGESIQMLCRNLRYTYFQELQSEFPYTYLVTAHHANDQVETTLLHWLRGSGLKGLTGIPQQNGQITRPLLAYSKNEIRAFAQEHSLQWREDQSNQQTYYDRNFIRLEIIPQLEKRFPSAIEKMQESTQYLREIENHLAEELEELQSTLFRPYKNGISIPIEALWPLKDFQWLGLFSEMGFTSLAELKKITQSQTGSQLQSSTHILFKDREALYIFQKQRLPKPLQPIEIKHFPFSISDPFPLRLEIEPQVDPNAVVSWDADKIHFPLKLRSRTTGDIISPSNLQGSKKLSKYLKDEKIPIFEKDSIALLVDTHDEILYIYGMLHDKKYEANELTTNYLNLFL